MPERQTPQAKPETLKVVPLTSSAQLEEKKRGRPRKRPMPPLPDFEMSELEREWFIFFIESHIEENPDLTDTDRILLQLAAIEYIKYLRVASKELATGEVISMARQHPFTNMRGLLAELSTTRRARKRDTGKDDQDDQQKDLLKLFGNA